MEVYLFFGRTFLPEEVIGSCSHSKIHSYVWLGTIIVVLEEAAPRIGQALINAGAVMMMDLPMIFGPQPSKRTYVLVDGENLVLDEAMSIISRTVLIYLGPEPWFEYFIQEVDEKVEIALRCFSSWGCFYLHLEATKEHFVLGYSTLNQAVHACFVKAYGLCPSEDRFEIRAGQFFFDGQVVESQLVLDNSGLLQLFPGIAGSEVYLRTRKK